MGDGATVGVEGLKAYSLILHITVNLNIINILH